MKIEELSIGDWVVAKLAKWDYDSPEETEPMRIVCIDNSEPKQAFADLIGCGMVKHSALIDDLRPIPLTPEILEKNGHKVCSVRRQFEDRIWDSVAIRKYHTEDYYHLFIYGLRIGIKLCDVHQLQHALLLAGIEKEIEV